MSSIAVGAVGVFYGYMQTVAAANSDLNVEAYYGRPVGSVVPNYLQVGNYEEGILCSGDGEWASMGVAAKRRNEVDTLFGCIRTWAGEVDPQTRFAECFSLYDALYEQILADPRGSGQLTGSGAWGKLTWRHEIFGPMGAKANGYGCVLALELGIVTAQTTS